ncbi:hypothetical protein L0657_04425 [Dyadobacter sp. CY345]|uniref:hypothetical protein n=1 Tax=Dyadobacter sp. CY345 TaxID=2909335 RepID=UPI001F4453DB|nr:hypothetical protein [Dyadobacter sp. CY345]MCF2443194.1 hypothetical protein [Dyadobacter sp. CY345]
MRKLFVLCLIVLFTSCKDKDDSSTPEPDYAPEFAGNYSTTTVVGNETTIQDWVITNTDKNTLAIDYTKSIRVSTSGTTLTAVQIRKLKDVKVTAADSFTINEVVDVEQTTPGTLTQKLEGTALKVTNGTGMPQLNITIKFTNAGGGAPVEEYLEFKQK